MFSKRVMGLLALIFMPIGIIAESWFSANSAPVAQCQQGLSPDSQSCILHVQQCRSLILDTACEGLSQSQRIMYCVHGCLGCGDLHCDDVLNAPILPGDMLSGLYDVLHKLLIDWIDVDKAKRSDNIVVDFGVFSEERLMLTVDLVNMYWKYLWPVPLVLLMLGTVLWGLHAYVRVALGVLGIFTAWTVFYGDWILIILVTAVFALGIFLPLDQVSAANTATAVFILPVSVFGSFALVSSNVLQLIIALFVISIIFALVLRAFSVKKPGSELTYGMMLLLYIGFLGRILFLMYSYTRHASLVTESILFLTCSTLPYGRHRHLLANLLEAYVVAFGYIRHVFPYIPGTVVAVILAVGILVLFFGGRAVIGASGISKLRGKFDVFTLYHGIWYYMVDVVAPLQLISYIISGQRDFRRAAYLIVASALVFMEAFFALDFLTLRLAFAVLDRVLGWGYSRVSKLLQLNFTSRSEFNKVMTFPAIDATAIEAIRGATVSLLASTANGLVQGAGFVVRRGETLYVNTVSHVVEGLQKGSEITMVGRDFEVDEIIKTGEGSDPTVSVKLRQTATIPVGFGTSVFEVGDYFARGVYSALVCITSSGRVLLQERILPIDENSIPLMMSLTSGDSGSPVFGVCHDGTMHLVGSVSRGTYGAGSANMASVLKPLRTSNPSPGKVFRFEEANVVKLLNKLHQIVDDRAAAFGKGSPYVNSPAVARRTGLDFFKQRFDEAFAELETLPGAHKATQAAEMLRKCFDSNAHPDIDFDTL